MYIRSLFLIGFIFYSFLIEAQTIEVNRYGYRTTGAYWRERELPDTIVPYLWLESSSETYFKDENGDSISCNEASTHSVSTWLDRSGNDRHFHSISSASNPTYSCDSQSFPFYTSDASVTGDGTDDEMRVDFETIPAGAIDGLSGILDQDFTFVFVMQAFDPNPGRFDSFIASGNSPQVAHNWQIGTVSDTSNFYFSLRGNNNANTWKKELIPFDTNPHVFEIRRYTTGSGEIRVVFYVDGIEVFDDAINAASAPTLSLLKMYKNRNDEKFIHANFFEFFVFTQDITEDQQFELSQYLLSKWGV